MSPPDQTTKVQQLFLQHYAQVKYFVLSLLPNPGEAEDIVQEVFLVVTAKANEFEEGTNFKAWVLTIARFKVLEHLRSIKRRENRLSDRVIESLAEETGDHDADREAAMMKALKQCLSKLNDKPRRMLELQYRENLKPAAIAERLGMSANVAYVTLARARAEMRTCVERQVEVPS